VADIITAVDEPIDATQCGGKGNCHGQDEHNMQCMTHDLWSNLNKKMVDYLQSVTLTDLVAQQEERNVVVLSPFIKQNKPVQISTNKSPALNVVDAKSTKKEPTPKRFIVNSVFNLAQQN
jgi:Rrf2 family iron-sulfur cluster assembly transcriptional regulator